MKIDIPEWTKTADCPKCKCRLYLGYMDVRAKNIAGLFRRPVYLYYVRCDHCDEAIRLRGEELPPHVTTYAIKWHGREHEAYG